MLIQNPFSGPRVTQGTSNAPSPASNQPPAALDNGGTIDTSINNIDQNNQNQNSNQNDQNNNEGQGDDPLKALGNLWEDERNADGTPKQPTAPKNFLPDVDQKMLMQTIGKMNFTQGISKEDLAAIQSGGEAAAKALPNILNKAIQQSVALTFSSTKKMLESGLASAQGRFMENVPGEINTTLARNNLSTSNAIMQEPLFAPMVDGVRARIQERFPKANASQVEAYVNNYFDGMKAKLSAKDAPKPADNKTKLKSGSGDANWDEWADLGS